MDEEVGGRMRLQEKTETKCRVSLYRKEQPRGYRSNQVTQACRVICRPPGSTVRLLGGGSETTAAEPDRSRETMTPGSQHC